MPGLDARFVRQCIDNYMEEEGLTKRLEEAEENKRALQSIYYALEDMGAVVSLVDSSAASTAEKSQELLSGLGTALSGLTSSMPDAFLSKARADRSAARVGTSPIGYTYGGITYGGLTSRFVESLEALNIGREAFNSLPTSGNITTAQPQEDEGGVDGADLRSVEESLENVSCNDYFINEDADE